MDISLQRVAVGLLLGRVVGIALALVSGLSRLGEDLVDATAPTAASSAPGSAGDAGPAADDPGIPAARRPGDERPPGIGPRGARRC